MAGVPIRDDLEIPMSEIRFKVSRAGGPGGQHVNKVSTRVTLLFDLDGSTALTGRQKARLRSRLATRIGASGELRVSCGRHRSQASNRDETLARFAALVRGALQVRKRRRETGVPSGERRRRLEQKRRRSKLKRDRRSPSEDR